MLLLHNNNFLYIAPSWHDVPPWAGVWHEPRLLSGIPAHNMLNGRAYICPQIKFLPLREESHQTFDKILWQEQGVLQDPLTRSKLPPDQVHQSPGWYTKIQQGTSKPKLIDYHLHTVVLSLKHFNHNFKFQSSNNYLFIIPYLQLLFPKIRLRSDT